MVRSRFVSRCGVISNRSRMVGGWRILRRGVRGRSMVTGNRSDQKSGGNNESLKILYLKFGTNDTTTNDDEHKK